jgi:hypothetical protein
MQSTVLVYSKRHSFFCKARQAGHKYDFTAFSVRTGNEDEVRVLSRKPCCFVTAVSAAIGTSPRKAPLTALPVALSSLRVARIPSSRKGAPTRKKPALMMPPAVPVQEPSPQKGFRFRVTLGVLPPFERLAAVVIDQCLRNIRERSSRAERLGAKNRDPPVRTGRKPDQTRPTLERPERGKG